MVCIQVITDLVWNGARVVCALMSRNCEKTCAPQRNDELMLKNTAGRLSKSDLQCEKQS